MTSPHWAHTIWHRIKVSMLSQEGSWESTIQIEVAFSFLISALLNLYFVNESNNLYLAYIYMYICNRLQSLFFSFFYFFLPFIFRGSCSSWPENPATKKNKKKTTDMEMQGQGGLCKPSKALSAIGIWAVIIHGTSVCSYLLWHSPISNALVANKLDI